MLTKRLLKIIVKSNTVNGYVVALQGKLKKKLSQCYMNMYLWLGRKLLVRALCRIVIVLYGTQLEWMENHWMSFETDDPKGAARLVKR